jgi:hypothetical protein
VKAAVGCGGVSKGGKTVADRKVDGGFNVHGYGSFSWRRSPGTGYLAEGAAFQGFIFSTFFISQSAFSQFVISQPVISQPVQGKGGVAYRRSDNSSDYRDAPWTYAADAGACGGVSGELTQIFDAGV